MTPKQALKIANLVGKHCTINCYLNGQQTEVLWAAGAQVSIVSEHFLMQKLITQSENPSGDSQETTQDNPADHSDSNNQQN